MAEDPRADHGEVPRAVCRAQEVARGQGGLVPVQEHLSAGNVVRGRCSPSKEKTTYRYIVHRIRGVPVGNNQNCWTQQIQG